MIRFLSLVISKSMIAISAIMKHGLDKPMNRLLWSRDHFIGVYYAGFGYNTTKPITVISITYTATLNILLFLTQAFGSILSI